MVFEGGLGHAVLYLVVGFLLKGGRCTVLLDVSLRFAGGVFEWTLHV